MLDYIENYTNHPWIVLLAALGLGLVLASVLAEFVLANGMLAGFTAIYAILLFAVAAFGVVASLLLRTVANMRSGKLGS